MPAAVPKAKSLGVSDRTQRSKPGVHSLDLNAQHLYTQQKRRDKPRKDSSLGGNEESGVKDFERLLSLMVCLYRRAE